MTRSPFRLAATAAFALAALPALALEPLWPPLAQPRPARVLPAQPDGTPSAVSGDPSWPATAATMPAFGYPARTDARPVYDPPVEAHVTAMAAVRPAAPAQLATR
jgi:hypothetical protein